MSHTSSSQFTVNSILLNVFHSLILKKLELIDNFLILLEPASLVFLTTKKVLCLVLVKF